MELQQRVKFRMDTDVDIPSQFLRAFPDEFINLTPGEQNISLKIYELLTKGKPVSLKDVAVSLDKPYYEVDKVIRSWPGVHYDTKGSIVGYWGLTQKKFGHHRFIVNDTILYTWCAWDSLFIPQIINRSVRIESKDSFTGSSVRLTITPDDGIITTHPESTVISFLMPNVDKIRADIVTGFCHYVHFFSKIETAKEWVSKSDKSEELIILPLMEAYSLGRKKNELQYSNIFNRNSPG